MSDPIPPNAYVIIIGAMKAGTTTLFQILSQHPAICPSMVKEPAFFVSGQGIEVDKYEDLFDYDTQIHTRCLEASTSYTKFPKLNGVPERMKAYGIEPYFIYSVRDPVDRIESDYNYAHFHAKAWANEEILNEGAIERSMYSMQMERFLEYYPDKSRYLIVKFNEIVAEPIQLAKRVFKWIGVKDFKMNIPEPQNVTTAPSKIELRLKSFISNSSRKIIPTPVKRGIRKFLRQNDSKASKKTLSDEQKIKLRGQIRSDIEKFGKDFDFNIREWGF